MLVEANCDVDKEDMNGNTALLSCSQEGHQDCVELLLVAGADCRVAAIGGQNALHRACKYGRHLVVGRLLEGLSNIVGRNGITVVLENNELQPIFVNDTDNFGNTALILAVQEENHEVVEVLLANEAAVDKANNNGQTALHAGASAGNSQIVQYLVDANVNVVNVTDNLGNTALILAVQEENHEVVEVLLANEAAVDKANDDGQTALHAGASAGNSQIVQYLVDAKANLNIVCDEGESALIKATHQNHHEIVSILLSLNADATEIALGVAEEKQYSRIVSMIKQHHLVKMASNLNIEDKF